MGCLENDPKLSVLVSRVMKNTKLNYVMVLRIGSIKDYNEALSFLEYHLTKYATKNTFES